MLTDPPIPNPCSSYSQSEFLTLFFWFPHFTLAEKKFFCNSKVLLPGEVTVIQDWPYLLMFLLSNSRQTNWAQWDPYGLREKVESQSTTLRGFRLAKQMAGTNGLSHVHLWGSVWKCVETFLVLLREALKSWLKWQSNKMLPNTLFLFCKTFIILILY